VGDRKADVQVEEVLALDLVGADAPQLGGGVAPGPDAELRCFRRCTLVSFDHAHLRAVGLAAVRRLPGTLGRAGRTQVLAFLGGAREACGGHGARDHRRPRLGRRVVVDLDALQFIDSSGLHVLMSGAAAENGNRAIVCPPGNVARVLSIVRADAALPVYEHLDEALDAASADVG
jgi:hypothetical protein